MEYETFVSTLGLNYHMHLDVHISKTINYDELSRVFSSLVMLVCILMHMLFRFLYFCLLQIFPMSILISNFNPSQFGSNLSCISSRSLFDASDLLSGSVLVCVLSFVLLPFCRWVFASASFRSLNIEKS